MGDNLPPGISQLPDEMKANFQRLPPLFSTTAVLMELMGLLWELTEKRSDVIKP